MMRIGRIALIAMMLAAFGLGACHPARAGEFQLGGRRPQDVFTNAKTAALAKAACAGDVAKIGALVKGGADVNGRGNKGITPLIWAMTCHNDRGIEALLRHGANPNQAMDTGESPVWLAAGGSDPKLLPILLNHGGNPNFYCGLCAGTTALMNAIDFNRDANMKLLVQRGADINFHDSVGFSVADTAVGGGRFDYLVYLLQHGYDYDLQSLANEIPTSGFGPHWRYNTYKLEALQILAAKGIKPHKVPWTVAPPPPSPLPAAASSQVR